MPVTKTAKRALRSSKKKESINKVATTAFEFALRVAKKSKKLIDITKAMSMADKLAKKGFIHKNKAARLKSQLSKLTPKTEAKTKAPKKTSKKK